MRILFMLFMVTVILLNCSRGKNQSHKNFSTSVYNEKKYSKISGTETEYMEKNKNTLNSAVTSKFSKGIQNNNSFNGKKNKLQESENLKNKKLPVKISSDAEQKTKTRILNNEKYNSSSYTTTHNQTVKPINSVSKVKKLSHKTENNYLKIKIKKGESLWVISQKYLKNPTKWRELLKYNHIYNPNKIRPGLILKVPDYLSKIILAKIAFYSGLVKVKKNPLSKWNKAYLKEKLGKNSKIRSYSKSRALLNFYTGDKLTIKENSLVTLSEIVKNNINTTIIKLNIGSIVAKVIKLKKGRAFNVETPSAVAGVRGTEFVIKSDKNKTSLFGVYDGKILVSAQGKEVVVNEGYGVEVKYGEPPSKPFKLPQRPEILK